MESTATPSSVHISYLMDLPSYLDARRAFLAQRVHPSLQWVIRWSSRLLAVLFLYLALLMPVPPGNDTGGHVVLVILATLMLVAGPAIRALWRLQYREQKIRETKVAFTFDPDVVALWTPVVTMSTRWDFFTRLVETREGFLLYLNDVSFHWLPGSAFEPHAREQFVAMARDKIPYKLSRR